MGASKKIKKILIDKEMTQEQFANIINKEKQQVRNALYRDTFTFKSVEEWLTAIDCDIVFRDKQTGKIYE